MNQLSQKEQKLIRALALKKYRDEYGLFVAEGSKVIQPLLPFFDLELLATETEVKGILVSKQRLASKETISKLSSLTTPQGQIALFRIPEKKDATVPKAGLTVALDAVQNPGNLGTIIRLCDWLGIRTLILGAGSADPFSSKVVQATAGALGNVRIVTTDSLVETLQKLPFDQIIGTSLSGTPVYDLSGISAGSTCVLFGNEGHGLSPEVQSLCTRLVLIPSAPTAVSESLNVSISAAILLSHIGLN